MFDFYTMNYDMNHSYRQTRYKHYMSRVSIVYSAGGELIISTLLIVNCLVRVSLTYTKTLPSTAVEQYRILQYSCLCRSKVENRE